MWIPKLTSNLFTPSDNVEVQTDAMNTFWIFVHKELIIIEISPNGVVELKNTEGDSLGSVTLDLATEATITDVDIGEDPGTQTEYLAFAVTSPVDWPKDVQDEDNLAIMDINE